MKPSYLGDIHGHEDFFSDDSYLLPVIEDDPLLRKLGFSLVALFHRSFCCLELDTQDWSDDDSQIVLDARDIPDTGGSISPSFPSNKRAEVLEARLQGAQLQIVQLQSLVHELVGVKGDIETDPSAEASKVVGEQRTRDDDAHYFESYSYLGPANHSSQLRLLLIRILDIHATMLQDHVRTSSYAKFILSNPQLFHDKLVMDVGCGE